MEGLHSLHLYNPSMEREREGVGTILCLSLAKKHLVRARLIICLERFRGT
jgi:hypothetical protein